MGMIYSVEMIWSRLASVVLIATALATVSCSPPAKQGRDETDLTQYEGKLFSDLVTNNPEFLLRDRVSSPQLFKLITSSDGIEIPAKVYDVSGRDVLVFFTCVRDKCSSSSNVIAVDLRDRSMHVVNQTNGRSSVAVEGAPDVASFVRTRCFQTSCDANRKLP